MKGRVLLLLFFLLPFASAATLNSSGYGITAAVVSNGGVPSTSPNYESSYSIGDIVGSISSAAYQIFSGFWHAASSTVAPIVNSVLLNATSPLNLTSDNLTGYVNATDADDHNISLVYNWYKDDALNASSVFINDADLIGYWSFNNDSLDYKGIHDGNATNTTHNATGGKIKGGYTFSGSEVINVSAHNHLDLEDGGTLSVWIRAEHHGDSNRSGIISRTSGGAWEDARYALFYLNEKIGFRYSDGITDQGTSVGGQVPITPHQWHHVVVLFNYTTVEIWLDGALEFSTNSLSTAHNASGYNLQFGYWNGLGYYNGSMDEIMIFNRTLNGSEINQLYHGSAYGGDVLDSSQTSPGDQWILGVTPVDYLQIGAEVNSTVLDLNNDTQAPAWNNNDTNAPDQIGVERWFFVNWSDDVQLHSYIFSWNGTDGTWQNDTPVRLTQAINQSNVTKTINLTRGNRIGWQIYANDTAGNLNVTDIFEFTVLNTPPQAVNLSDPLNGSTIDERAPTFNWSAAYDADNDTINYTLVIEENPNCQSEGGTECIGLPFSITDNETAINTTQILGVDTWYNWSVIANDSINVTRVDYFNFSIAGFVSLSFDCNNCTNLVEFETVSVNLEYNTTDNSPTPLRLENNGNVLTDIDVNATELWESVGLDLLYFQFRAGNSTEQNSFNWSNSTIQFTPMNITMKNVIGQFNYSNATDVAEVDLSVRVPPEEGSGNKTTTIVFEARYYVE